MGMVFHAAIDIATVIVVRKPRMFLSARVTSISEMSARGCAGDTGNFAARQKVCEQLDLIRAQ